MSSKIVGSYAQNKEKILSAVRTLSDPIRQTLSPRGRNVVYQDAYGQTFVTNDGATIAKNISLDDPVEEAVIDIMKQGSLQTNMVAGDATSTTVMFSDVFITEGIRLIDGGMNAMEVKERFSSFADKVVQQLKKQSRKIKTDKDLFYVASISSNNDNEIAGHVVKTIKTAGEDGMVFIEPSNTADTEVIEDSGFNVGSGLFAPELRNNERTMSATYMDVPVLITDKRLYYGAEAETILNVCLKNGYKEVVIVAKDFIGDAPAYFITNHARGSIRVLLVKEPNVDANSGATLEDLAIYLGGHVVSDKSGSIVDNLKIEDFVIARRVFSDTGKTLISRDEKEPNKKLASRISSLKKEAKQFGSREDDPDLKKIRSRLASLTTGIVTVRVGGHTGPAVREKIYRYEDAINASRVAMKHGFVVGGGLAMLSATQAAMKEMGTNEREMFGVYRKIGEASVRQIAENCGLSGDLVLDNILSMPRNHNKLTYGFNALTGVYDDLIENGVIDPLLAEEMAIRNAADIAGLILSAGYYIVNKPKENGESKK